MAKKTRVLALAAAALTLLGTAAVGTASATTANCQIPTGEHGMVNGGEYKGPMHPVRDNCVGTRMARFWKLPPIMTGDNTAPLTGHMDVPNAGVPYKLQPTFGAPTPTVEVPTPLTDSNGS